jgi:hypothetical protein
MARKRGSSSTAQVEKQLAVARREVDRMLNYLASVDRDVGRTASKKQPAKYQKAPFKGGAESLIQDIEAVTAKNMKYAFGRTKGMKSVIADVYREISNDLPEELNSFSAVGADVFGAIAYNVLNVLPESALTTLKAVKRTYIAELISSNSIVDAIKQVKTVSFPDGLGTSITIGTLITRQAELIYPYSMSYIKYLDAMVSKDVLDADKKARFILDNFDAMYSTVVSDPPPVTVPMPNVLESNLSTRNVGAVKGFFKNFSEYSLDDTFKYLSKVAGRSRIRVLDRGELNAIKKGIESNFSDIEGAVTRAGLGTSENLSEIRDLKSRVLACVKTNPSIEDIKEVELLLTQAQSSAPIDTVEAIGTQTIFSRDLTAIFSSSDGSGLDPEEAEIYYLFSNVQGLVAEYKSLVLTTGDADAVEKFIRSQVTSVSELRGGTSTELNSFIETQFKSTLEAVQKIIGSGTFVEPQLTTEALNGLLVGYVDGVVFSTTGTTPRSADIDVDTDVKLIDVVAEDLANGGSLDIINLTSGDIVSTETNLALDDMERANLKRQSFDKNYKIILKVAETLQERLDATLTIAMRDPSLKMRKNPALSTMAKVGVGSGAFVGTHALTALTQRLVNSDGQTSGMKYHASEYTPPALVAGLGLYLHYKSDSHKDFGMPLVGGALASVVLREATRRISRDNVFHKYFLKYVGVKPAELIGDKTFDSASVPAPAPTPAPAPEVATENATNGFGQYVSAPIVDPQYVYQPPIRVPASITNSYTSPAETGRIYSGTAGLGRYFSTTDQPLQHHQVDQEHDQKALRTSDDPELSELVEGLGLADPLTSSELHSEGLGRFVNDTVIMATDSSAMKLQDAGVAEVLKHSDSMPNMALIRVLDGGQPVAQQVNPSMPTNEWYGPQQVSPAQDVAVAPSGIFSNGIFSSQLPKA